MSKPSTTDIVCVALIFICLASISGLAYYVTTPEDENAYYVCPDNMVMLRVREQIVCLPGQYPTKNELK